jgi:hypothetical protein
LRRTGFRITLRRSDVDRGGRVDVHVLGAEDGAATLLRFACGVAPQQLAC